MRSDKEKLAATEVLNAELTYELEAARSQLHEKEQEVIRINEFYLCEQEKSLEAEKLIRMAKAVINLPLKFFILCYFILFYFMYVFNVHRSMQIFQDI